MSGVSVSGSALRSEFIGIITVTETGILLQVNLKCINVDEFERPALAILQIPAS